jgi:hypothetical protein
MWSLFTLTTFSFLGFFIHKIYRLFYPFKMKSFEDDYEEDEYNLLCYHIKFEDGTVIDKIELTDEEILDIDKENKIKYVTIDYMFNGQFMKYISYEKDISFPPYDFKIEPPAYPYYPETVILNGVDITNYVIPYLGPLQNFYGDRYAGIKLEDTLLDHPEYDSLNLKEGKLTIISNKTPLNIKKCITRDLPCSSLIWKRHAALDPSEEIELKKSKEYTF